MMLCATLSCDKIASGTWHVTQLFNSCTASFPIRNALCSVQLFHENAVNACFLTAMIVDVLVYYRNSVVLYP